MFEVRNAVKQFALQCTTELHNLLWEDLREWTRSGPSAVPPACTVHQPSSEWARITPLPPLPLPQPLDAFFSQAPSSIFLSPAENEWVHTRGWKIMDGDSWEHFLQNTTGTFVYSGKKRTNMHIPLCCIQKLNSQYCCMGDNWINSQILSSFLTATKWRAQYSHIQDAPGWKVK